MRAFVALVSIVVAFVSWRNFGEPFLVDAIEYAVGAANILKGDGFVITINGISYPPFFSYLISPGFLLSNELRAAAIIPSILLAVGIYLCGEISFRVCGSRLAGVVGALAAPQFVNWGGMAMTDSILAIVTLCSLYLYVSNSNRIWLVSLLLGFGAALKFMGALIYIPWIFRALKERRFLDVVKLSVPFGIVVAVNAYYQYITFGDPFRSGYQYWVTVPYDFFNLTFSLEYLNTNLLSLKAPFVTNVLPLLLLGLVKSDFSRRVLIWSIPWCIFLLLYFYNDVRLYLPVILPLSVALSVFLYQKLGRLFISLAFIVGVTYNLSKDPVRFVIEPPDSTGTIISNRNAAYINYYFPDNKVLPKTRGAEYASKVIMKKPPLLKSRPNSLSEVNRAEIYSQGIQVFPQVLHE